MPDSKWLHWLRGYIVRWSELQAANLDQLPRDRNAVLALLDSPDRYTREIENAPAFQLQVEACEVRVIVDGATVATIERPTEDQIAESWAAWKGGYDGDY